MEAQPLLKVLLRQRHWQTFRTFQSEYDKAAASVDPRLVGKAPSRAQLYRWLSGDLKSLPHPDHCRVLEEMFTGRTVYELFQPAQTDASPTRVELNGDGSAAVVPAGQFGEEFTLTTPMTPNENPRILSYSLSNPTRADLLYLTWETFGLGVERIIRQIKNIGRRLDVNACFGVNEAGLVMATFLASAQFDRCAIGYLKCLKSRESIALSPDSHYPEIGERPTIVICDFEVKRADVIGFVVKELRARYRNPEIYFAVFGAMTDEEDPRVEKFEQLTGARIMEEAGFAAVFIATTMHPPGIEPPLELR